jgi:hypothetical protein
LVAALTQSRTRESTLGLRFPRLVSSEVNFDIAFDQGAGLKARRYKCWRARFPEKEPCTNRLENQI